MSDLNLIYSFVHCYEFEFAVLTSDICYIFTLHVSTCRAFYRNIIIYYIQSDILVIQFKMCLGIRQRLKKKKKKKKNLHDSLLQ